MREMKDLYRFFLEKIDSGELERNLLRLGALEHPQTSAAHGQAADFVFALMQRYHFSRVEKIDLPADGRTVYQDKKMPLGWNLTRARLTALDGGRVLADYEKNPLSVVRGSVAAPAGGLVTRLITEAQFLAGEDARGALVLLDSETPACGPALVPILDRGGLGFVNTTLKGQYTTPDSLQWCNNCTEYNDWHVTEDDRPFICFSVSPRTGDWIRNRAQAGVFRVKVESDARRCESVLPVVTGVIPGSCPEEIWVIAHLYEPLLDDDASGAVGGIEALRRIAGLGKPRYTVRLILASEVYGFAAYDELRRKAGGPVPAVLGACNLDALPAADCSTMQLCPAGEAMSYAGNDLLYELYRSCREFWPEMEMGEPGYRDDMCLGDPTVGIPTTWMRGRKEFWHNSIQTSPDYISPEIFRRSTALAAAYLCSLAREPELAAGPGEVRNCRDLISPVEDTWMEYALSMVMKRKGRGFPFSLAAIPPAERRPLPDLMLYGPFADIMARLDGRTSLGEIVCTLEENGQAEFSDQQLGDYIQALDYLADYGYLEVVKRPEITRKMIDRALAELGIGSADVLLVHSSFPACGYICGGASAVVESLRGAADTVLFPAFTNSFIWLGGLNRRWDFRPYDRKRPQDILPGSSALGRFVLERIPGAARSEHMTHSWAGLGRQARECLEKQGLCDAPAGESSPMAQALQRKGKILYFGAGLKDTLFLHYLEDQAGLPYLEPAVCQERTAAGTLVCHTLPGHFPGHRDFHDGDGSQAKFFRQAVAEGLDIRSVRLGMGRLQLIDLQELEAIGRKLIRRDPRILLCNQPDCPFCRK